MKIVSIIPARKGSKRLKHKNIFPLKGKPLIEYTLDAALGSIYLSKDTIYISTDFPEVMEIGNKYKVNIHKRSDQLSGDKIWTQDVVNDAIKNLNLADDDLIVILQANSPQITTEIIDQCIDKTLNSNLWEVHTVDNEFIHNGAIQVIRKKVCDHKGKVNYNGFVLTNWVDVHTKNDIELLEKLI